MTAQTGEPKDAGAFFVDNSMAPDVFADEAVGFFVRNGVVSITFASVRVNHSTAPAPVNRVVIGRLVMSVAGAQGLALGLYDFLAQRGLAPEKRKSSN